MFFKHFASKNQLPGLPTIETLVENVTTHWQIDEYIKYKDILNKKRPRTKYKNNAPANIFYGFRNLILVSNLR